jgi:hypothetical protein
MIKKINQIDQNKSRKTKEKPFGPWPSLPSAVLRSKDRRIGPIIKKTRLVKTTKLKVLLESDVYSVSPPEPAQLITSRSSIIEE